MYGNWFSKSGKSVSEDAMTSIALTEAKEWADELMNREFSGRGDREKSARFRLSKKTGVPESYLFRLQYKTREMKDVAGEVYRRLKLAYDAACLANEKAAERYKTERLELKNETTGKKPASAGMAIHAPRSGAVDQAEA